MNAGAATAPGGDPTMHRASGGLAMVGLAFTRDAILSREIEWVGQPEAPITDANPYAPHP